MNPLAISTRLPRAAAAAAGLQSLPTVSCIWKGVWTGTTLCMCMWQGAARSFAFASGMAALAAVLRLAKAGDHVVAGDDLYGGTSRLLAQVAPQLGLHVTHVDTSNIECACPSRETVRSTWRGHAMVL